MDIYRDNIAIECDELGKYVIKLTNTQTLKTTSYPCGYIQLMWFEKHCLLRVDLMTDQITIGTKTRLEIIKKRNDSDEFDVVFETFWVDCFLIEKGTLLRIYCDNQTAKRAKMDQINKKEDVKYISNTIENKKCYSQEQISQIHEKYFAKADVEDIIQQRRMMRRRQMGLSQEETAEDILKKIEGLIGLNAVKREVDRMVSLDIQREFLDSIGMKEKPNDMLFLGNPGTGKTTVARYMTEILHKMGKLRENKCVEINGHDLVGGYVGQTAYTVDKHLKEASGGVLFIDEAYSLLDGSGSYTSDAITKLLGALTKPNRDFVCILAGYENEMNELMRFNAGFESRIATKLYFEDYSPLELGEIFCELIKKYGYRVERDTLAEIVEYFATVVNEPNFSNGRFVRNLFEKMEEEHCQYFDGTDEAGDVLRITDLTDKIKQELVLGLA